MFVERGGVLKSLIGLRRGFARGRCVCVLQKKSNTPGAVKLTIKKDQVEAISARPNVKNKALSHTHMCKGRITHRQKCCSASSEPILGLVASHARP